MQTTISPDTGAPVTTSNMSTPQLTASDRCDSCGAQAYIRVVVSSGELMFCAHHGKKYQSQLSPIAESWHDESSRLVSEARP